MDEENQLSPTEPLKSPLDTSISSFSPLLAGTNIHGFTIQSCIFNSEDRNDYIAVLTADPAIEPESAHQMYVRLVERPGSVFSNSPYPSLLELRHPRLLAARERFHSEDRDYLALDAFGSGAMPEQVNALKPEEAIIALLGICEVFLYLAEKKISFTAITADDVVLTAEEAYLNHIENAEEVEDAAAAMLPAINDLAAIGPKFVSPVFHSSKIYERMQEIARRGEQRLITDINALISDYLLTLPDGLPELTDEQLAQSIALQYGYATSVGKVRTMNQDAIGVAMFDIVDDRVAAEPAGVFVIADGMGGEAYGEVASRIASRVIVAEVARRFLSPATRSQAVDTVAAEMQQDGAATAVYVDSVATMVDAFRSANTRIHSMAQRIQRSAGTTSTAIVVSCHDVIIGHVGDSRAYMLRNNSLSQLTIDHSLAQKFLDMGQLGTPENPIVVPRNYLYRSLGQYETLDVDTRALRIAANDVLMLCSDGLWDMVPDELIHKLLSQNTTPQAMAESLVQAANDAGGSDNSAVIVIRVAPRFTNSP